MLASKVKFDPSDLMNKVLRGLFSVRATTSVKFKRTFDPLVLAVMEAMPTKRQALAFISRHSNNTSSTLVILKPKSYYFNSPRVKREVSGMLDNLERLGLNPILFLPDSTFKSMDTRFDDLSLVNVELMDTNALKSCRSRSEIPVISPRQFNATTGKMETLECFTLLQTLVKPVGVNKIIFIHQSADDKNGPVKIMLTTDEVSITSQDPDVRLFRKLVRNNPNLTVIVSSDKNTQMILQYCITDKQQTIKSSAAFTIIKNGFTITRLGTLDKLNTEKLQRLLESSFGKNLDTLHFLDRLDPSITTNSWSSALKYALICEDYRAAAIVTTETSPQNATVTYLDKFAVLPECQGTGIVDQLWSCLLEHTKHTGLLWRSRSDNGANKWYFDRCDGHERVGEWIMFYIRPREYYLLDTEEWWRRLTTFQECVQQLPKSFK